MESKSFISVNKNLKVKMNRFATIKFEEENRIVEEKNSKNTTKAGKIALKTFIKYCAEKKMVIDIKTISLTDLCDVMSKFYLEARKEDGGFYKLSSFVAMRHNLQREFQKIRDDVDLIRGEDFRRSNIIFDAQLVQLKKMGLGKVDHTTHISKSDLALLTSSGVFSLDSPLTLQNKVFFDIMFYFCRRGRENLRNLKKDDFIIKLNERGDRFIVMARDELDKNHRVGDKSEDGGIIKETKEDNCPVASFLKYKSKLNPKRDEFFQRPKDPVRTNNGPWYDNQVIGVKSLEGRMKQISTKAGLTQSYTNHSIRATFITELDNMGVEARHIMAVSGHRSEASIRSYASTSQSVKERISENISSVIKGKRKPCFSFGLNISVPEEDDGEDLQIIQKQKKQLISTDVEASRSSKSSSSTSAFDFHNCNVTIHYNSNNNDKEVIVKQIT